VKLKTLLLLALPIAFASCGSEEPATTDGGGTAANNTPEVPTDIAAGAEFFATTCTPCHGPTGKGDGAASAALVPKPRDLTDVAWQDSVDDAYIAKIIQYGGAAVGKQPTMPANPVLGSQPEVLNGLVAHIRTLSE